jgi:lipid-A-disaccharide synthase
MLTVVKNYPNYQFIIGATNTFTREYYQSFIKDKNVALVFNETYGLLSNAKAAFVTSGTATLETALFKVPQVVCYKTNWLTYIIGKSLIKIEYLSLVNILLNKTAVKELIQTALNKGNLSLELSVLFSRRDTILKDYNKISDLLNKKGASRNTAQFILSAI